MNIVVLDGHTENPGDLSWAPLEALGTLTVYDRTAPEDAAARMRGAQAVYTNKTRLTRALIEGTEGLRFIGVLSTGYDVVDIAAAAEWGIPVCNVPSYGTQTVAQYTFALLLALCHRVEHHNQTVQAGRWAQSIDFSYFDWPQVELAGKTMGIIGYGRIGQAVSAIAQAFGMHVLVYDPGLGQKDGGVLLEELLAGSDIVSLHCPLTPENRGMIGRDAIAQMREGAYLINTARGGLLQEMDVREAVLAGKLAGVAVDVVSEEPIRTDNPLLGLDRVLITPHIAWAAQAARQRLLDVAVDNLRACLAGSPQNVVNADLLRDR